jgi:hypothetical protein
MNNINNHSFTWWSELEEDYWKDIKMKLEVYEDDALLLQLRPYLFMNELAEDSNDWSYFVKGERP